MQIAEMVLGPASQEVAGMRQVAAPVPPIVEKLRSLLTWLKKKFASAAGEQKNALTISGRVSLGPKKSLVLVEVRGQSFLVAMSGDSTPALMAVPESSQAEEALVKKRSTVRKGRTSC